ncbi:DUF1788 domain-containing protein [uncultured Dubosiella sp.]|uniref:DUF1788 domain-containing protein n=1 Tax=uncultured Dubosiella sp. TaxID=1937011 RepID=UPI0025B5A871|nr:DUF1788 domain-containing protein [uncultured Dubosiella sp.]
MKDLNARLDHLKSLIQEEDFLLGKGLSNEVNIRIFCYGAKEEMAVRYFTEHLKNEPLKCKVHIVDLYETLLSICEDKRILARIPQLEERRGKDFLAKQLERSCDAKTFAHKIVEGFGNDKDVLMITGVGKVFPFMRVHSLLNALQEEMNEKPVVVFYPGEFNGHYLKLFNQLKANEYYRAFSIV